MWPYTYKGPSQEFWGAGKYSHLFSDGYYIQGAGEQALKLVELWARSERAFLTWILASDGGGGEG